MYTDEEKEAQFGLKIFKALIKWLGEPLEGFEPSTC